MISVDQFTSYGNFLYPSKCYLVYNAAVSSPDSLHQAGRQVWPFHGYCEVWPHPSLESCLGPVEATLPGYVLLPQGQSQSKASWYGVRMTLWYRYHF